MKPVHGSLLDSSRRIYLSGIGGVGMSGLAKLLQHRGFEVAGSDRVESRSVRELKSLGISVYVGQKEDFLQPCDLFVYSSAIQKDHPEMIWAQRKNLPILHRAEALASVFNLSETSVAITGTHGKTTTSSMIAYVLSETGRHPTCLVGGDIANLGTNAILGGNSFFVSEVDESDGSQVCFTPNYSVLTNLEEDHMDHYMDLENLKQSMAQFISNMTNPGLVVYSLEDPVLRELVPASGKPHLSFGWSPQADIYAEKIRLQGFHSEFDLFHGGFFQGRVLLSVPGAHNILNAMGAMAVLLELGLDFDEIAEALFRFRGARRRLEVKLDLDHLMVIDDYAHHPAEVRASLRALKNLGRRLTVVFQPHRFSRTQYLGRDFGKVFKEANEVILTEIYGAGEKNPDNVSSDLIYRAVREENHPDVKMVAKTEVIDYLLARNTQDQGEVIAFLGAGDIGDVAEEFSRRVKTLRETNPLARQLVS